VEPNPVENMEPNIPFSTFRKGGAKTDYAFCSIFSHVLIPPFPVFGSTFSKGGKIEQQILIYS